MDSDPIVDEVHRFRAELLAKFNGDLHAYVEDVIRRQTESGRPTITFRKPVETVPPTADKRD